jgi:hypothetical protein
MSGPSSVAVAAKEGPVDRAGDRINPALRGASRFYWAWLVFATGMSILGNVTHALLVAPDDLRLLAAIASVVPPTFVLGSTHSVAVGLTLRRYALAYMLGLVMTIGVAACAFVLSFDALRGLAVMLGWPSGTAWLFPIVIDVSIAQATFGLLSLSSFQAKRVSPASAADAIGHGTRPRRATSTATPGATTGNPVARTAPKPADLDPLVARWERTAHELIRNGTTSKDPQIVAAILAEHAIGIPPSTISRRRNVHHSTVGRILQAAQALGGQDRTSHLAPSATLTR